MEEIKTNLNAIEVIGKILIFTPLIVALPLILYAIVSGKNVGIGDAGAGFSAGLMIFAGILALLYVSVKQYKEKKEV
ncbi:MAG: hypothetical protein O8C64_07190 [Candidatus Methanoperedens sp.]|jgi:hypothetical protein|nr:hypothetical protein [Candidatus Methanoperedens sp.]MCZ7405478.1 hypothetical protein [Candidatus Methanoperedens sp.]